MAGRDRPSVNALGTVLADALVADAPMLRLAARTGETGCRLVDAGVSAVGGIEAGRRIAELALGGLGRVSIASTGRDPRWPFAVTVTAADPVVACLGSQYAGWKLGGAEGGWSALGSGPARALAATEPIFEAIGYRDRCGTGVLILETDEHPPAEALREVADAAGLDPSGLTVAYAPTESLAGSVQVVARVLEVALSRAHAIGFPLDRIVDGMGTAPLPPPSPSETEAMGRTNDAIIYGGRVHLFVDGPDADAESLAAGLPSTCCSLHGRPFAEIFEAAGRDFYAIDTGLFAPAEVLVTALESGRTFRGGSIDSELVDASFS